VGAVAAAALLLPGCGRAEETGAKADERPAQKSPVRGPDGFTTDETPTPFEDASTYNNFYEFGTDKEDPSENASTLVTKPWSVAIEGEVAKPGTVPLEALLSPTPLVERVYRLRCVEAWSMVIPWRGVPLREVLARFEPTSRAKYVAFETLVDPEQMPGQRREVLRWPYREGLRMDEAMHPLAILAVGMYGTRCRIRTARRSASSCRGSMASRASSRS
jgi:sulfoxide reductase catalytic subunit YedY